MITITIPFQRAIIKHCAINSFFCNSILQLDNESNYDINDELSFKLSHYSDDQTISTFCSQNNSSLNFMSLNAQSVFSNIHMIRHKIEFLSIKYKFVVHLISIQEG